MPQPPPDFVTLLSLLISQGWQLVVENAFWVASTCIVTLALLKIFLPPEAFSYLVVWLYKAINLVWMPVLFIADLALVPPLAFIARRIKEDNSTVSGRRPFASSSLAGKEGKEDK